MLERWSAGALEGEGLGHTKVTLLLEETTLCYRSSGSSFFADDNSKGLRGDGRAGNGQRIQQR